MKIAQVPPLYESVPPKMYGGTERVVSYLTEELVNQGHEVTLFGTEDSITKANLLPICKNATRLNKDCRDPFAYHILQMQKVAEHASDFDIIHFHTDYLHYPFSKTASYPHITTLHGRLDMPELKMIYECFNDIPVVSISNNQRIPQPTANWAATIYHGLPQNLYKTGAGAGGYLTFLGRISPEKRPDRAIEIALKAGIPLKIAAKVDKVDQDYFDSVIKPMINHPLIEFIGEVGEDRKGELLGNSIGLLFPIDWPEPFGMVMIEAMANGTPVIAFGCGSVPEIILDGVNGYIVNSIEDAVDKVGKLSSFDRIDCRAYFDTHFTATTMTHNYVRLYKKLVEKKKSRLRSLMRIADNTDNLYVIPA